MAVALVIDNDRCPANGVERGEWHRRQANRHPLHSYLWARYTYTAIMIETRHEGDEIAPTLPFSDPIEALVCATVLRQLAGQEDDPSGAAEMVSMAQRLEGLAMGEHGVTSPRQ